MDKHMNNITVCIGIIAYFALLVSTILCARGEDKAAYLFIASMIVVIIALLSRLFMR